MPDCKTCMHWKPEYPDGNCLRNGYWIMHREVYCRFYEEMEKED